MQTDQENKTLAIEAVEKPRGEIDLRIAASRLVMQLDLGGSRAALITLANLEKETAKEGRAIEFFGDLTLASAVLQAITRCREGGEGRVARALEDKFGKYVKIR